MKHFSLLLCLMGLWLTGTLVAQPALLTGAITDANLGQRLPGATIRVDGAGTGTYSNQQGWYELSLPAGTYTIEVSYLGFSPVTERLTLAAGETRQLDIALSGNTYELRSVEITGYLQGQARALNQQRSADNIKNVVAADQIGRFPDPNVAEALQRVPGVNIERDQGEGRYVLVRGLAPQFTNISVNGEQIPSPEGDVRFVALDAIPADQLAALEVTKALTPDMDGDAIGGSVNLITRTAQSGAPQVSGSLLGGYNHLMRRPNIQGSGLYGQRFGAREQFGALVNLSYYHNDLGSDNWEREPFDNELELRDYELTRTRVGLSSTFDYRFNPNSEIYFRALASRFTDREWRRRYVFKPEDGEIERNTKDRFESQSVLSFNLGGRHSFPRLQFDYEAQYSYGEQNTPYDYEGGFIAEIDHSLDFSDPNWPTVDAPGYLDNSAYEFDELAVGNTLARDRNLTARFNLALPYHLGDQAGQVKMGAKVRLKAKTFDITQDYYSNREGVPTLDAFTGGLLDTRFLGNRFELASPLNVAPFIGYLNQNPAQFELEIEDKAIDEALEAYEATENVYAGYLMARQQAGKLLVLGGLRYEYTRVDYASEDVVIGPDGDLAEIVPVEGTNDYGFLLPQLHVKYSLTPNTNLRAAGTFSYARPNFSEIIPAQEINIEDNEATVGNPNLEPVRALNLDLLGEHYFGNVGIVSGGIFYKRLSGFIYSRILFNSPYPLTGPALVDRIDVIQAQNGEDADLLGAELAFQRKLDFLPGALAGLSLYLNYTYTQSEARIQSREADAQNPDALENLPLPGQAAHVGNVSLAYEWKRFNLRLSANFNGAYLSEVGGAPEEDTYVKDRLQLDLNASYTLSPRLRLFTEFLNLTNQPFEVYQGSSDVVIQREFYAWWMRLGLKLDL